MEVLVLCNNALQSLLRFILTMFVHTSVKKSDLNHSGFKNLISGHFSKESVESQRRNLENLIWVSHAAHDTLALAEPLIALFAPN